MQAGSGEAANGDQRSDDLLSSPIRLAPYGMALTDVIRGHSPDAVADVLERLESLGVGAVWFGESVGGESFATSGVLLARSRKLVVACGIANIAARSAAATAAGRRILTEAYAGRFLLGLGSSHPALVTAYGAARFGNQVDALRDYIDAMLSTPGGIGERRMPIVVAALGPRMLDLSVEYGFGTHPWNVTVERTAWIRDRIGPATLLAPRQAIMLCDDADTARRAGRAHLAKYLAFPNYHRNWLRQGFDEKDLAGGPSDRLVDEMVAWGPPDRIALRLGGMWEAGADHIAIHPIPRPDQTPGDAVSEAATFLHDTAPQGLSHRE